MDNYEQLNRLPEEPTGLPVGGWLNERVGYFVEYVRDYKRAKIAIAYGRLIAVADQLMSEQGVFGADNSVVIDLSKGRMLETRKLTVKAGTNNLPDGPFYFFQDEFLVRTRQGQNQRWLCHEYKTDGQVGSVISIYVDKKQDQDGQLQDQFSYGARSGKFTTIDAVRLTHILRKHIV